MVERYSSLTPAEHTLRAQIAAHDSWAKTEDPSARTVPARQAFKDKFLAEADGDPRRAELTAQGVLCAAGTEIGTSSPAPRGRCRVTRRNPGTSARATSTTPIMRGDYFGLAIGPGDTFGMFGVRFLTVDGFLFPWRAHLCGLGGGGMWELGFPWLFPLPRSLVPFLAALRCRLFYLTRYGGAPC